MATYAYVSTDMLTDAIDLLVEYEELLKEAKGTSKKRAEVAYVHGMMRRIRDKAVGDAMEWVQSCGKK